MIRFVKLKPVHEYPHGVPRKNIKGPVAQIGDPADTKGQTESWAISAKIMLFTKPWIRLT